MTALWRTHVDGVPPRADNPWATHLPVLLAVSRLRPIRRVLELGSGNFSTRAFLSRGAFPLLEQLVSVEDDPEWQAQVALMAGADDRFAPRLTSRAVSAAVADGEFGDLGDYDLVFVDDSRTLEERSATIRAVAERCGPRTVVVMHDFEVPLYQRAAHALPERYRFTALNPNCGVGWSGRMLDRAALRRADRLIRRHARELALDDIAGWMRRLDQAGGDR